MHLEVCIKYYSSSGDEEGSCDSVVKNRDEVLSEGGSSGLGVGHRHVEEETNPYDQI